jgi:hypothetical protein
MMNAGYYNGGRWVDAAYKESLMIPDVVGQQLHDKATRGVALSVEEQAVLTEWYARHDEEERLLLFRAAGIAAARLAATPVVSESVELCSITQLDRTRFPELIKTLYRVADELKRMFGGHLHFTPDGHMVGSIGEALASFYYGISLFPASYEGHDGKKGDRLIQIKATQGDYIGIRSEPQHLLVLRLAPDGNFTEEYNGPGRPAWALGGSKPKPKNGQYQIRLSSLRKLMKSVREGDKLPRVRV